MIYQRFSPIRVFIRMIKMKTKKEVSKKGKESGRIEKRLNGREKGKDKRETEGGGIQGRHVYVRSTAPPPCDTEQMRVEEEEGEGEEGYK